MRQLTVNDLKREAARHGATVTDESAGRWKTYYCEAPAGHVWSCDLVHDLCVTWMPIRGNDAAAEHAKAYRNEAIGDAIERMKLGTEKCADADCDYCNE